MAMFYAIVSKRLIKAVMLRNFATTIRPPRAMSKIVWMDMEMTGLDVNSDRIMEVACLITDNNLNIVAEGPNIVIHQPDSVLATMDEWCTSTHTKTGLYAQCQSSTTSVEDAESAILKFLVDNDVAKSASPLAGNTIYMDRMFLRKYMPRVDDHLHYRIIDVSSVKELCKRWNSKIFSCVPSKKLKHRGLDDIRESIDELQFYKQYMFQKTE